LLCGLNDESLHSVWVNSQALAIGGVTKATVSIVFDNSDVRSSPPGYEHAESITVTRSVVIGGRNKYLINGHAVQANTVQDLFHVVQLNVNNPHFLIMQVRPLLLLAAAAAAPLLLRPGAAPGSARSSPFPPPSLPSPIRPRPARLSGPHHQGAEHEAAGDPGHDRGGGGHAHVRVQEAGGRQDDREEAGQGGRD
jgi:hypothetical protein